MIDEIETEAELKNSPEMYRTDVLTYNIRPRHH